MLLLNNTESKCERMEKQTKNIKLNKTREQVLGYDIQKTPGEDGFSKEFYETFFDLLNQNLLDSYNEAFQKGSLLSVPEKRSNFFNSKKWLRPVRAYWMAPNNVA